MARWLRCLHCRLTARRSWVRFPHEALLALGGRSSPDLQCSGGLSPGPFCVEFACSPRVHKGSPPLRTPTEKTCKRTEHSSSVPDQDRRVISPGPRALKKAAHCSWGPGGRTVRDGINAEAKFTNDLRPACVCVCVCVCPVSPPCIHVCAAVCRLCD